MSVILPAPKAVIFDWDNTLVDTWPIIHEAINSTFRTYGMKEWTFDETRARVRKSMRDSFPEVFGENWQEAGVTYQNNYKSMHLDRLTPLPGSEELLKHIKSLGLYNVVVSNKKGDTLRKEVEKLGWAKYFDAVVGSQDADHDKPHAAPVLLALKDSPVQAGLDVWFVGDSDIDLECAKATGCCAVLYGELARGHPEFSDSHFMGHPYHHFVLDHAAARALIGTGKRSATA
ncbi:MAG: HAD family hydrolase [Alphaproteobacteria bacterium]